MTGKRGGQENFSDIIAHSSGAIKNTFYWFYQALIHIGIIILFFLYWRKDVKEVSTSCQVCSPQEIIISSNDKQNKIKNNASR